MTKHLKPIISASIFMIGLLILLNSVQSGKNEAQQVLNRIGSMDTNTYLIYIEQSITKYRYIGTILSLLGGLGLILYTRNS